MMLIPSEGIVLYKGKDSLKNLYAEKGKFVEVNGEYKLQGLSPFSFEQIKMLMNISQGSKGIYLSDVLPKNVVFYQNSGVVPIVVWCAPAKKRKILFNDKKLTKEYNIPNTVFVSIGTSLSVFFIKEKEVNDISMNTKLYLTHFLNVHDSGSVCIGNGYRLGKESVSLNDYMKRVEFNFFEGSKFNSTHRGDIKIMDLWKDNNGEYLEKEWTKHQTLRQLLSPHKVG